jgi:hypothetical protein
MVFIEMMKMSRGDAMRNETRDGENIDNHELSGDSAVADKDKPVTAKDRKTD